MENATRSSSTTRNRSTVRESRANARSAGRCAATCATWLRTASRPAAPVPTGRSTNVTESAHSAAAASGSPASTARRKPSRTRSTSRISSWMPGVIPRSYRRDQCAATTAPPPAGVLGPDRSISASGIPAAVMIAVTMKSECIASTNASVWVCW